MSDDDCLPKNNNTQESHLQVPSIGASSGSKKRRGSSSRGSKNTKDSLIGIISELNHNLKQNTSILVQMKESLSNLSLYQEEKDQLRKEIASLHGSGEGLERIAKLLTSSGATLNTSSRSSLNTSNHSGEDLRTRGEVVRVEIRVVFLKIGEIDTIKEQFQAEVFIEAKWKEPSVNIEELDSFDPNKYWNPNLEIENAVGDIKSDISYKIVVGKNDPIPNIYEMRKVKGTFLENLELYDFPVDVQDLSITLTTSRKCGELEFFRDSEIPSSINTQTFIDQQEWKLYDHVEVSKRVSNRDSVKDKSKSPAISFTCHAGRRPGYFYWNVYFLIFFITIMIFATFSVKPNLPQNRLQLGFTLLLTAVTFKFVVNRCLPTISYLTSLCIICSWHSFISIIDELDLWVSIDGYNVSTLLEHQKYLNLTMQPGYNKSKPVYETTYYFDTSLNQTMVKRSVLTVAQRFDRYALFFFSFLYIFSHIVFVFWMYFSVYKRRRIMKIIDKEYLELVNASKPVMMDEFELSGSNNHLVYQSKCDMNNTIQKMGIKAMIDAELMRDKEPERRSININNRHSTAYRTQAVALPLGVGRIGSPPVYKRVKEIPEETNEEITTCKL